MVIASETGGVRPRIEGDREAEILDTTIDVLLDVGYDRLTLDAVAKAAKASKATLYRRWETKPALVIDALIRAKQAPVVTAPDTGSLRGDLLALYCRQTGLGGTTATRILGAVVTALNSEPEFAATFREQFIAPKISVSRLIYQRAADRGEVRPDVDLEVVAPAFAGIVMHRAFVLGQPVTDEIVERIIDQLILPAVTPITDSAPLTTHQEVPHVH